jgi:hypothetical protein
MGPLIFWFVFRTIAIGCCAAAVFQAQNGSEALAWAGMMAFIFGGWTEDLGKESEREKLRANTVHVVMEPDKPGRGEQC